MMHFLGIDIGSTATKAVVINSDKTVLGEIVVPLGTGTSGAQNAIEQLYGQLDLTRSAFGVIVATGYGRNLFAEADTQISELSCHAKGIHHLFPEARVIIDIGGQDLKVIRINENGTLQRFVMNDKCAAGTGRFLETMCRVLAIELQDLQEYDLKSTQVIPISNTCTVFAESEVISILSAGKPLEDIVAGIHQAVAKRVTGLALQIGLQGQAVLTGGVAQNVGIVRSLNRELHTELLVPQNPQVTGALGAALFALEQK